MLIDKLHCLCDELSAYYCVDSVTVTVGGLLIAAPDILQSNTVDSSKYDADEMSLLMLIDDDMSDSEPVPPKSSEYVINVMETAAASAAPAATASAGSFKTEWHAPKVSSVTATKAPSNSNTIHWGPGLG